MSLTPPPLPAHLPAPKPIKLARLGLVLSLFVIAMSVVFVLRLNALRKDAKPLNTIHPNAVSNLLARYAVGWQSLAKMSNLPQTDVRKELAKSVEQNASGPVDRFRAEIIVAALYDRTIDESRLRKVLKEGPELKDDLAFIHDLNSHASAIAAKNWQWFEARHGWIARLAHATTVDLSDPFAVSVYNEARLTAVVLAGVAFGGFALAVTGLVLLIRTLIAWRRGKFQPLAPLLNTQLAPCFVEGFALYLFAYTVVIAALHRQFDRLPDVLFYSVAFLFVLAATFWPRWRGVEKHVWRSALGFHRGAGVWREMKTGIVGWITGLPVLAAAAMLAPVIQKWTGTDASHPIVEEFAQPGAGKWGVVALAVIWAPITEETMFRGLLFPGLSSFTRWIAGALLSALVFALIHPQGWAGVPAITAIALTLTTLRLFRGSIIASMTAHALNNGLVSLLLIAAA